jgi:N utilization substance protein A
MDGSSIKAAIKQICAEKGLSEESVLDTIDSALAAAYRKDFGEKNQNVLAEFDLNSGKISVWDVKEVVEDLTPEELAALEELKKQREAVKEALASGELTPEEYKKQRDSERNADELIGGIETTAEGEEVRHFNPKTEIQLVDAKKIKKTYKIGDIVKTQLEVPGEFGRMAAQTAKQVIVQRLREAERNVIYQEFKDKEGSILNGLVQKIEGRNVIVDLDKISAILPPNEQIRRERYRIGDRLKVFLKSVSLTTRGPELIVSRVHEEIVRKLFVLEIPEIANNTIEIRGIAREAGARTKIAVSTEDKNIDPIGSCIGQRGARIQTIIAELNGEKIDIIEYNENPEKYIANALLPAKINDVKINTETKVAIVTVPQEQLSLTIGRAGQNVRLASRLTGWSISIKEAESGKEVNPEEAAALLEEKKEETIAEPVLVEAETTVVVEKKKKPTKKKATKKVKEVKEIAE